jgi:hypothetical protein
MSPVTIPVPVLPATLQALRVLAAQRKTTLEAIVAEAFGERIAAVHDLLGDYIDGRMTDRPDPDHLDEVWDSEANVWRDVTPEWDEESQTWKPGTAIWSVEAGAWVEPAEKEIAQ